MAGVPTMHLDHHAIHTPFFSGFLSTRKGSDFYYYCTTDRAIVRWPIPSRCFPDRLLLHRPPRRSESLGVSISQNHNAATEPSASTADGSTFSSFLASIDVGKAGVN